MAHAHIIKARLKLYDEAQAELKVIHRKVMNDNEIFQGMIELPGGNFIFATLFQSNQCNRLWVEVFRGHQGVIQGDKWTVLYYDFMKQWPEFGRRKCWKDEWEKITAYKSWDKQK